MWLAVGTRFGRKRKRTYTQVLGETVIKEKGLSCYYRDGITKKRHMIEWQSSKNYSIPQMEYYCSSSFKRKFLEKSSLNIFQRFFLYIVYRFHIIDSLNELNKTRVFPSLDDLEKNNCYELISKSISFLRNCNGTKKMTELQKNDIALNDELRSSFHNFLRMASHDFEKLIILIVYIVYTKPTELQYTLLEN